MRKKVFSVILILVGVGLWFTLANTARLSIKKWDAKFGTVLRHSLSELGVADSSLVSSVNQIKKDEDGEWVTQEIIIKLNDPKKIASLVKKMESSGAQIQTVTNNKTKTMLVKRGDRIYQEITFIQP